MGGDEFKIIKRLCKVKNFKFLANLGQKIAISHKNAIFSKTRLNLLTENTSARNMKFGQVVPYNDI